MNFQQPSYSGYPGQSQPNPQLIQQQHQFRPQGYPQPGLMTPSNLSAMMAQGYAQQQQMLQQQQQGHPSGGAMSTPMRPPMGGMPGMQELPQGMTPQMMMAAAAQRQMQLQQMNQSPSSSKKKKNAQVPRHHPRSQEAYMKGAMGVSGGEHEPWADALDELDSRELAMGRFRARQEILTEIFGPERIKDIPLTRLDAWEGLGMDGETLEAKVLALEKENADLQAAGDSSIETWRQNLHAISDTAVAI